MVLGNTWQAVYPLQVMNIKSNEYRFTNCMAQLHFVCQICIWFRMVRRKTLFASNLILGKTLMKNALDSWNIYKKIQKLCFVRRNILYNHNTISAWKPILSSPFKYFGNSISFKIVFRVKRRLMATFCELFYVSTMSRWTRYRHHDFVFVFVIAYMLI